MSYFTVDDLSSFTHTELAKSLIESEKDRELAVERATKAEECAAKALTTYTDLRVANAILLDRMRVSTNDHARMTKSLMAQLAEARSQSRSWGWWARLCRGTD